MPSPEEIENRKVRNSYRSLLRAARHVVTKPEDKKEIRKAFNFALEAHKGVRRKSGELYIFHPLEVATIATREIGLGTTSIICSLLHDVVEDTDFTLDDIEEIFGPKVAGIIDGLTKISGFIGHTRSMQAENFRKILLTLSKDVRVILIKLADRLHNMRTLDSMSKKNQLKISSETLELFAPLAHRLGLFTIKSELEDLSLKYTEPAAFQEIDSKIKVNTEQINRYTRTFMRPIHDSLRKMNFEYEVKARYKSRFSIYKKMKKQGIPFEKIYDLFAIRIILTNPKNEKADCWQTYSIVTDFYKPNSDRLRDWLSTPKVNGYESLHTTVMGPKGRWVEVQIRTQRMDDIAEKGYAAHWKYKENNATESGLDDWIKQVGELFRGSDTNAIEFFDEFKLNLFSHEKYVFTPKGELKTLPDGSSTLDFAFMIHTDVGLSCLGAKVNNKLVPLNYKLRNGDQIEIITSKKIKPSPDWLEFVITARAKSKIKQALKEQKRTAAQEGQNLLLQKLKFAKLSANSREYNDLLEYFSLPNIFELYYQIGTRLIKNTDLNNAIKILGINEQKKEAPEDKNSNKSKPEILIVGENTDVRYSLANCCSPIPGDEIFGYISIGEGIIIHRTNCPEGITLMSNYGYRIIDARWGTDEASEEEAFSVGIKFTGFDNPGLISEITSIISKELKVNMRSIKADAANGTFEGTIIVDVLDTNHLESLTNMIKNVEGIESISRFHVSN